MSEIRDAKARAQILVRNLKTGKVLCLTGRYGTFCECYEHARKNGFRLIQYTAVI